MSNITKDIAYAVQVHQQQNLMVPIFLIYCMEFTPCLLLAGERSNEKTFAKFYNKPCNEIK